MLVQSFSEEEFNQQPPDKDMVICIDFNHNYGTFMALSPPVLTPMDRYPQEVRKEYDEAYEVARKQRESHAERTHVVHILFQDDVQSMCYNISLDDMASIGQQLGIKVNEYSHHDWGKIFAAISLPEYLTPTRELEFNLKKQFDFLDCQHGWKRFVINAFRANERKNLVQTHVLVCRFLFDFQIGKMSRFTRYYMIDLKTAKKLVPSAVRRQYLCLDEPERAPILMVEEWSDDLYAMSNMVHPPPPGFKYWKEEQSVRTTTFFFEELKALTFPVEGLAPSPPLQLRRTGDAVN